MNVGTKSLAAGCISLIAAFAFVSSADAFWGSRHYGRYQPPVVDYGGGYGRGGYRAGPAGAVAQAFYGGAPTAYYGGPPIVYYGGDGVTIQSGYHRGQYGTTPGYGGW